MKELAILGLATILCFSGQVAHKGNQELTTAKYPVLAKEEGVKKEEPACSPSKVDKPKIKGKSAARRVIEGIGPSNSMVDADRKSAARKSMEEL